MLVLWDQQSVMMWPQRAAELLVTHTLLNLTDCHHCRLISLNDAAKHPGKGQIKRLTVEECSSHSFCVFCLSVSNAHILVGVEALQVDSVLAALHRPDCRNKWGNMAINRKNGGLPSPTHPLPSSPLHTTSYWTNKKSFNSFLPSAGSLTHTL